MSISLYPPLCPCRPFSRGGMALVHVAIYLHFGAVVLVDMPEAQEGVLDGAGQIQSGGAAAAHREGMCKVWCTAGR